MTLTNRNLTRRMTFILILMLSLAAGISAQEASQVTTTSAETTASAPEPLPASDVAPPTSHETKNQFASVLRLHPPELSTILALDPTLLSNEAFLAGYPKLAGFVAQHPEVRRNPRFFLEEFSDTGRSRTALDEFLEGLVIFSIFLLIALALAWLVRTTIEQKRWNRLSRTQTEVHTKILDRFGTSGELLEYMKTPAGSRFLESAPIPLHSGQGPTNSTLSRSMWSIQIGVVIAAGAVGLLLVSGRFDKESSQALFAMGAIAFCVGAGFIASAIVSIVLSRRLGLWSAPDLKPADAMDE